MAEILLSLTIIGVVAAITLPSLTGNINERTWNTQRKALYARMSQAISLMPSMNGYGILSETTDDTGSKVVSEDTVAETFITEGLAKVLKINNICDANHLSDCGIPDKMAKLTGDGSIELASINTLLKFNEKFSESGVYSVIDSKSAAFETQNGESILVHYNPKCVDKFDNVDISSAAQSYMCANFIYDLNGKKGPNTVGKDIGFISALYASDSIVVAPMPLTVQNSRGGTHVEAVANCKEQDSESRLPNKEELSALFYNKNIIGIPDAVPYMWSSSISNTSEGVKAYVQNFTTGYRYGLDRVNARTYVWCVKR